MRTVGEILSAKRKEMGLSFADLEKETKIRKRYLEAIEKNNYSSIAESTTVKGFIRNYAQALGLSAENILAVFRRDFKENERGQIIPRGMVEPLDEKKLYWTPKATFLVVIAFWVFIFAFFFVRQYFSFSSSPPLEVESPRDGEVIKEKAIVSGKTDRDASVKIDGTPISITEDGYFKEEIVLPRGDNVLTIESANRQGKKKIVNLKVKVE
ncbi:MAG: helix-turn-helix domain-containing protein [Patescibacteria group bacterium]|nr:helix-turn-helix domain-containing protein [Patescibacteria group bacterium]